MSKTYNVYVATDIFGITAARANIDSVYHAPFIQIDNMSESSLEHLKAIADKGEIAIAYMANEKEDEDNV